MRAIAQFTIINLCDVIASDTAPENPYVGMLWVNTATVPPETMVWDGLGWVVQNNLEELRTTVSTHTTRFGEFQSSIDGMNSYVSSLTETNIKEIYMNVYFDVTSSDNAYSFLLNILGLKPEELVMDYLVECGRDIDLFLERNGHHLDDLKLQDVRFVAFHVTASLDDCQEIKENGIRDLQYVLSHNTMLSRLLKRGDIDFDIENRIMCVNGRDFDIDYEHYRGRRFLTPEEERLDSIAHRIYYDFCVDGFWANDDIERYGTDIHERPEFISKLIKMSPKAKCLDAFWRDKSKPYKIFFYATLDQIHKFTFGLEKNYDPYTEDEQEAIKNWMLRKAIDQAFDPGGEHFIYIRDYQHIPPEQIIKCEMMKVADEATE